MDFYPDFCPSEAAIWSIFYHLLIVFFFILDITALSRLSCVSAFAAEPN